MYHSYKKYNKQSPIIHCKSCRGVLLRIQDIVVSNGGVVLFDMRCPHCKKNWSVTITIDTPPIIKLSDN